MSSSAFSTMAGRELSTTSARGFQTSSHGLTLGIRIQRCPALYAKASSRPQAQSVPSSTPPSGRVRGWLYLRLARSRQSAVRWSASRLDGSKRSATVELFTELQAKKRNALVSDYEWSTQ